MYPSLSGTAAPFVVSSPGEAYDLFRSGSVLDLREHEIPMTETSGPLLQLLSLPQGRRDWSGVERADRLGVSGRTIRRDVERLRRLGYPVDSLTRPAGRYRPRAGTGRPPPARGAG